MDSSQLRHQPPPRASSFSAAPFVLSLERAFLCPLRCLPSTQHQAPRSCWLSGSLFSLLSPLRTEREDFALTLGTPSCSRSCLLRSAAGGSVPASLAVMQPCWVLHVNDAAQGGIPGSWEPRAERKVEGCLPYLTALPAPALLQSKKRGSRGMRRERDAARQALRERGEACVISSR